MNMKRARSRGDKIFDAVIALILILLAAVTIIPFMQVVTISLSPIEVINKFGQHIIPEKITLEGYRTVFKHQTIWNGYLNTIVRTVVGTVLSVFLYICGAYPLSKKHMPNKKFWTLMIIFTMYFSGGLIPNYLLVTKTLGMKDSFWSLILPGAMSAYTLIIVRNFFMEIPEEIEESAKLDGANDIRILFGIIVPLSKPVLATVSLWTVVYHWNSWFDCMLYISDEKRHVLQLILRRILLEGQVQDLTMIAGSTVNTDSVKMAALVVATLPIIIIYPFLQKYFVKGVMVGAVKG